MTSPPQHMTWPPNIWPDPPIYDLICQDMTWPDQVICNPVHKLLGNFRATCSSLGNFLEFRQLSQHWATFSYFSNISRISMIFCLFFVTVMKIRHVMHLFSGQAGIQRLDLWSVMGQECLMLALALKWIVFCNAAH